MCQSVLVNISHFIRQQEQVYIAHIISDFVLSQEILLVARWWQRQMNDLIVGFRESVIISHPKEWVFYNDASGLSTGVYQYQLVSAGINFIIVVWDSEFKIFQIQLNNTMPPHSKPTTATNKEYRYSQQQHNNILCGRRRSVCVQNSPRAKGCQHKRSCEGIHRQIVHPWTTTH